jgi:hypothetical protein
MAGYRELAKPLSKGRWARQNAPGECSDIGEMPLITCSRMALAAIALLVATSAQAAEKAAVFDFQLANLAISPPTQADQDRLPRLSDQLRKLLADSGRYDIVSTDTVKADVAKGADLRACGGCAVDFAKKLGADVAITAEIQKVSVLILNINVYIKDVNGTKPEKAYSVDIRGDTDESFDRGVKYIVKHNILGQ